MQQLSRFCQFLWPSQKTLIEKSTRFQVVLIYFKRWVPLIYWKLTILNGGLTHFTMKIDVFKRWTPFQADYFQRWALFYIDDSKGWAPFYIDDSKRWAPFYIDDSKRWATRGHLHYMNVLIWKAPNCSTQICKQKPRQWKSQQWKLQWKTLEKGRSQ